MKRTAGPHATALVGTVVLMLAGSSAWADDDALPTGGASGGPYRIDAMTIDGGGVRSATGAYIVEGTTGQHDADPLQPSSGGAFSIVGGFWPAATASGNSDLLFADGFEAPLTNAPDLVPPSN